MIASNQLRKAKMMMLADIHRTLLLPGTPCACCCMKCHVQYHSFLLAKHEAAAGSQPAHDQVRLLQTHAAIAGQHQCILLLNRPMQPG